jgi:hypothetical protein
MMHFLATCHLRVTQQSRRRRPSYALSGALQGGTGGQALLHSGPPDAVQPLLGLKITGWLVPRCLVAAEAETQRPITIAAESTIVVLLNIFSLPAKPHGLARFGVGHLVRNRRLCLSAPNDASALGRKRHRRGCRTSCIGSPPGGSNKETPVRPRNHILAPLRALIPIKIPT